MESSASFKPKYPGDLEGHPEYGSNQPHNPGDIWCKTNNQGGGVYVPGSQSIYTGTYSSFVTSGPPLGASSFVPPTYAEAPPSTPLESYLHDLHNKPSFPSTHNA